MPEYPVRKPEDKMAILPGFRHPARNRAGQKTKSGPTFAKKLEKGCYGKLSGPTSRVKVRKVRRGGLNF